MMPTITWITLPQGKQHQSVFRAVLQKSMDALMSSLRNSLPFSPNIELGVCRTVARCYQCMAFMVGQTLHEEATSPPPLLTKEGNHNTNAHPL